MMRAVVLLLALVAGCSQPQSSTLEYAGIAFDESNAPTAFAIRVRNASSEPVFLREALANVTYKTVIFEGDPPPDFDYAIWPMNKFGVSLPESEAYELPPGKTGELWYAFQWKLPPDAPPMVAIVQASFTVPHMHTPAERVETTPKVFLLQSRGGALEALMESTDSTNAAKVAAMLEGIEGDKSERVEGLIQRMREVAAGTSEPRS